MPTVTSQDGTTIAFDKVGSDPAVILVNGAMAYRAFDPSLAHLAELLGQHFTVYNYDRRGRGVSSDTQPFAREREMEDLQALVEDAGGQAMVFGFSSGGVVSLDAAAVTTAAPVVVVDSEVFARQFGQLCHTRVKGTIHYRTVDQDDGWAGPNLVESNFSAIFRSYCLHGILLFLPFYETVSTLTTGWTTTFAESPAPQLLRPASL